MHSVAPSVSGQQGTAVIPTVNRAENSTPTLDFKPWSKLGEQQVISCYSDDGRVVVNSELNAASKIFAAGSVAKYPNHLTGHATVAGEGIVDGSLAGAVAAENMAKEYHCQSINQPDNTNEKSTDQHVFLFSQDKDLPILRTDKVSTSGNDTSSLSSLGIHALCVGNCDSENMSTHGFWWTNQSLQNRRLSMRLSNDFSRSKDRKNVQKAVYGSGVVFYLDREASIRGIMIWGLPFTTTTLVGHNDLNKDLLGRIQTIIRSNGEIIKKDHQTTIKKLNIDPTLLSQLHLAEESKLLSTLAMISSPSKDKLDLSNSRPLHRFIPSKPINVTSMGVLKRNKAIGNGSVGDDIYQRNIHEIDSYESSRHPSLVHYFSYDWSSSRPISDSSAEESYIEDTEDMNESSDIMSRPPKEEPLWLRKNEAMRTISFSEKMTDMFAYNLRRGQFFDGNDAVKQAPTPKFIVNAREELGRWSSSDDVNPN